LVGWLVAAPDDQRDTQSMSAAAIHHLSRDRAFAQLIGRVGPPRLAAEIDRRCSPYEALMRAIAHQQLHARAAQAILERFVALHPDARFPTPAAVLQHPEAALRGCGFSAGKIASLRDICAHALNGTIPSRRGAGQLSDLALIERLTAIRGVGRWTVEMLLIFALGRPDVLPVDDFGVREGYRVMHGLAAQPKPRALAEIGIPWAPYRSLAAWYLWRAAEIARPVNPTES
jgi:DNA-3-methyladenine glycosylase II